MSRPSAIRPRVRDAIIQSLRAGVVPRVGQQHIQVGRACEVKALNTDIDRIGDGGSAFRLVVGDYGSGKTFFLMLVRSIALEKNLVTCHADLNPDRRLHATQGQGRSLFAELMRNMSTRTKQDGGGMMSVVQRFVQDAAREAEETGTPTERVIHDRLEPIKEMVGGYDFATVLSAYWRGHSSGNEALMSDAVRWLRGEFTTKTDARNALGVRTFIDDSTIYDHLKLTACFMRMAGYKGLLICLDEMVNLYKLSNTQARRQNYEQLLRILNDSLQGASVGLGFVLGGTPDFLMDTRRGLYSYEALQSRLAENPYLAKGMVDFTGPVIRLANLTPEDLYVLLAKLQGVFVNGNGGPLVPDEGVRAFMQYCSERIGDAYFKTPRNSIKAFMNLLATLEQNPGVRWMDLLASSEVEPDPGPGDGLDIPVDDEGQADVELSRFRI